MPPRSPLPVPDTRLPRVPNLPLQLKYAIHQSLSRRRAPRNVDVDWEDPVDASEDAVAIVIVSSAVGARPHADDPAGLGHLIVAESDGRRHLVGDCASDDHDVGLSRGGSEDDAQAVLVVPWHGDVHHFDTAAR